MWLDYVAQLGRQEFEPTWVLGHTREAVQLGQGSGYFQEKLGGGFVITAWAKDWSTFWGLQFRNGQELGSGCRGDFTLVGLVGDTHDSLTGRCTQEKKINNS